MKITCTAIGTCRVELPLFRLARRGDIYFDQRGVYGRTHTTKEALQVLRTMSGDFALPRKLRPFVAGRPLQMALNDLSGADVLLLEVSSVKEIVFREYFFQLVLTTRRLEHTSARVRDWWRAFSRNGIDAEDRAALLGDDELPPVESAFVAEGRINMQGPEEMRADMAAIAEWSPIPVLFVTHFDAPNPKTGKSIYGRAETISAVKEAGAELGYRVYDPTADVLAYAAERGGLSEPLDGVAHYTNHFIHEVLMGKIHSEAIAAIEVAGGRKPPGRDRGLRTRSLEGSDR
jgi:hypothetical protein